METEADFFNRIDPLLPMAIVKTAIPERLSAAVLITSRRSLGVSWFESRTIELFSAVTAKRLMTSGALKVQEDLIVS